MCIRDRCVDNLEEGPGCSIGVRRIRQRLQHVKLRLQNLDQQWGEIEPAHDVKGLIQQITSTLQRSQPGRPPTPAPVAESVVLAVESSYRAIEPAANTPVFSSLVAASYHKLPNPLSQICL